MVEQLKPRYNLTGLTKLLMYPSLSGMPWLCRSHPVLRVLMVKQSETSGSATAAAGWQII